MDSSIYLAKVIGIYLIFWSVALIIYKEKFRKLAKDALASSFFIAYSGFMSLILGLLIVVAHNYWFGDWTTLITVFGWLMLFQGFMRVFFPKQAVAWGKQIVQAKNGLLWMGWIMLAVGLYMAYMGYMGYADSGMMGEQGYY